MLRKTVIGAISAVTAGAVISLFGAGMANASVVASDVAASHGATHVSSYANQIQRLHDQLGHAAKAGDVLAAKSDTAALAAVLDHANAVSPSAVGERANDAAVAAKRQNAELAAKLAQLPQGTGAGHAVTAATPNPLATVSTLLQTLLASLQALVASLLGSVPAPPGGIPAPPAPIPGA